MGKETRTVDPTIASIIRRYAPIAIVMKDFYRKFQTKTRMAQFPVSELERAARKSGLTV
jgi:hypothetical protein